MPIERPATWATMSSPLRLGVVELAQHLAPHLGVLVGLVEVHADGAARAPRQVGHPRPLVDRDAGVVGRELEHAVPGARRARRRWPAARRAPRRCPARARRPSSGGAGCGWWRSRAHPPAAPPRTSSAMPEGVVGRSPARWRRPARPSRRPRQRAVGDLGADVEHLRAGARRRRGTRGSSSTPT